VVTKLFSKIIETGLINNVKRIFVVVLGRDLEVVKKLLEHSKVMISFHSFDMSIYERKCLLLLREHAEYEDFRVLYIHSKGITKARIQAVHDWVDLLIYFTIDGYKECIKQLGEYDTCGVNLNKAPDWVLNRSATIKNVQESYHYSGNFWWANSTYIRRLSTVIGPKYLDPELWIGTAAEKNMLSLWQSNVDHYCVNYPSAKYIGKQKHFVYNN